MHFYVNFKMEEMIYRFSYLALFLFSIRFLNKNNTFLIIYVLLSVALSMFRKYFAISRECLTLLFFGLFYYFTKVHWGLPNNSTALVTLALGGPLMYIAGKQFTSLAEDKEKYYIRTCWITAIGMFLFAILSYLKNGVIYNYEYGKDLRQVPDLWVGNESLWQATNINGYCVFAIIISIVAIIQKARVIKFIAAIILLVESIYLSLVTAARTNLFLTVLVIVSYVLVTIFIKKNFRYVSRIKALYKFFMLVLGLVIGSVVILKLDAILYRLPLEAFMERQNNRQLSLSEDGRWDMWSGVIKDIPTHFWGNITSVETAHNIFLDVAREAGVIPMILLVIFTGMVLVATWKVMCDNAYSFQLRVMNSVLVLSLLASFLLEPVMTAMPFVFIAFCMVCGMQNALLMVNE